MSAPLLAISMTGDGAHLIGLIGIFILVILAAFGAYGGWRRP